MGRTTITVYKVGGYDPSKPNNNVLEEREVEVPEPEPTESDASRVLRKIVADDKVKAGELSDEDVRSLSPLYEPWRAGETVEVGDLRSWDGTVIECIQGHTNSDPNHTPDATPALWKIHRSGEVEVWSQPGSTNGYPEGYQVTHNGRLWQSDQNDNVWEPGTTGAPWTDIGSA